jgi:phage protein D
MKDSAIASQVAREAGLRATVSDTRITLDYVVQHNQTDLEFLQRRAQLIGYQVFVRDKVLHFRPPGYASRPSATLEIGRDIVEFAPRLRSLTQVGDISVRGWDVKQKSTVVGSARVGRDEGRMGGTAMGPQQANRAFGRTSAAEVTTPVRNRANADQIAIGRYDDMALEFVQGEAVCVGAPRLTAGSVVDIRGAGTRFSGHYYVAAVTHTMSAGAGLRTELDVRRSAS